MSSLNKICKELYPSIYMEYYPQLLEQIAQSSYLGYVQQN